MGKEYKQLDLFTKSGKVKKIDTIFEIELEDGNRLRVNEEDAKKIFDDLYKTFGYKYPCYCSPPFISPTITYPYQPTITCDTGSYTWNGSASSGQ